MIYKFKNGGIIKLQNKGKIPRKQQKMFDRVTQSILNDTRDKNINTTGGFAHRTEEPLKVEHPGAALLLRKMPIGKVLTVLGNPVSASTTAGAMAATAADAAGVVASAQGLANSTNKIKSGDYTWRDVPETVLSAMGALPGASVMTRPGSWVTAVNTAKRYGEPIVNSIKPIVVARNIRIKHPELIKQISFNGDHAQSLITAWNNNTGQFIRYNPKLVENARKVNSALLYGKDPTLESAASLSGFKNKTLSRLGINKNIINTIYGTNQASKKLLAAKNLPENVTLYSGAGPKQLKYLDYGQEHEVYIDGDKVIKFKFHRNPESYLPHNSNYSTLTDEFTSTGAYRYKKQGADFIPERKYLGVGIDDGGSLIPVFEEDFIKGVTPTQLELNEALAKNGIKYDGVKQVVFKDGSIAQDVNPKNVKLVDGKPIIIDPITGSAYNPNSRYYKFKPRNIVYGSRPISEAERLGIPKGERSNPKALEDPYYWGYKQWNQKYFNALYSGNYPEVQRLRDLHFKIKAPDTKVVDEKGMPIHMYHGIADRHNWKRFQQYRGVNWDVEYAVKAGDKRSHWKISEPNTDVMANYHTSDYKTAIGSYGRSKQDLVYDDYLNITKPSTWGEDIHNLINSEYPGYSKKILHTIPAHHHTITGELIPARQIVEYTGVPDWARFNGLARKILMKHGYDGLYIPQYYDSYGAFISPSQFKSAEPITWNGKGEIVPIVKRDNFHNLDRRYKQGGILKAQHGILTPWYNLYNSKVGEFVRNLMFGKDYDLSDEEYVQKYGYAKPITGTGMLPGKTSINAFEGVENLVKGSFGTGAKYNSGLQAMKTKAASKLVEPKATSNWDKFFKKSLDEQNKIVKYWDERYSTMRQLQANQKQFKRFVNWINKQ